MKVKWLIGLAILVPGPVVFAEAKIEKIIEHGLYSSGIGNIYDVALNPATNHIYLSQSGPWESYIHTLDHDGNLVDQLDFIASYGPQYSGAYNLAYDSASGNFFIIAVVTLSFSPGTYETHLVEMATDGALVDDHDLTGVWTRGGDYGMVLDDGGIWLYGGYSDNSLTHITRDGQLLQQIGPTGYQPAGATNLCEAFAGGFFVKEHSDDSRVVELASDGSFISEISMAIGSWDGQGIAAEADLGNELLFVNDGDKVCIISGVPEPASALVLILGICALRCRRRGA